MEIRVIKHQAIEACGSFEVRADGHPLRFFYWDDLPSRRLREDIMTGEDAKRAAVALARAEWAKLDSTP